MSDTVRELRQLERAATPGPWYGIAVHPTRGEVVSLPMDTCSVARTKPGEDAVFIAAMRNALPALLDLAEAAREVNERTAESLDARDALLRLDLALSRLDRLTEEAPGESDRPSE